MTQAERVEASVTAPTGKQNTMDDTDKATQAARIDDLWRFYEEHATHARQHEDLRAKATSTMAAIGAALIGLAGVDGIGPDDIPAGFLVIAVSALGAALNIKHYERFKFHSQVLAACRREIESLRSSGDQPRNTFAIRKAVTEEHAQTFAVFGKKRPSPWTQRIRLNLLWLGLPVSIGLVGALVIALSLTP